MERTLQQVEVVKGDLLKSPVEIIVHQVNMQDVMGAGLAKSIKKKFPEVYKEYKEKYKDFILGQNLYCATKDGRMIVNMFAQSNYGRYGRYTNYEALERCFSDVAEMCSKHDVTVGIPYGIGCGLGGGDWKEVYPIINKAFKDCNLNKVKIYKL